MLTGSTPVLSEAWLEQLKPGGRIFAVVGDAPAMSARMVRWQTPGAMVTEDHFETVIAPLQNAAQPRTVRVLNAAPEIRAPAVAARLSLPRARRTAAPRLREGA